MPLLQETSKSDRVSLREGSRLGLTAVGAASVALLPVHPGGGIQGAFPPWRPLVVTNDNNNRQALHARKWLPPYAAMPLIIAGNLA